MAMTDAEIDAAVAEYEAERAAMYEFEAGLSREVAERRAAEDARMFARSLAGAN